MADNKQNENNTERKIIDEADYNVAQPAPVQPKSRTVIGKGGDSLFKNIRASKEQLTELLKETTTIQDWIQRESGNNAALSCLENQNLKEIYFEIKDGFDSYGPIMLMGFKTPQGVEIPRLKIYDKNGEVIEVLTGPLAIDELNKRAIAYKKTKYGYEPLECSDAETDIPIADYSGNPEDYT